jgi:hypothetical protein
MNKINWTAVAVFGIVVLVAFLVGASLLGGGWGMMGTGMMGGWGLAPFGWIGMIFMWLIPIGFIVLTVLGVVWLVRAVGGGATLGSPARPCPSCGRGVQADWRNCPHCGAALA